MFTKEDRSSFPYWFAHWCAFQMTALNFGCWQFHHLFHDAEKPWLKLFLPYKKVQKFHRLHNSHHIEYFLKHGKANWLDLVIDWECSHFTKSAASLRCRECCLDYLERHPEFTEEQRKTIHDNIISLCDKFNI